MSQECDCVWADDPTTLILILNSTTMTEWHVTRSFCEDVYILTVCIDRYSMISMYNHTWNWFHKLLWSGLCVYFWLFCWWFFLFLPLFPVLQCGVWQEAGLTLVKQQQGTPVLNPRLIKLTIKDKLSRLTCFLMSHIPAFFVQLLYVFV